MVSILATTLGRLLVVPVALSGVCLTMLLGTPMAHAMSPAEPGETTPIFTADNDQASSMVSDANQAEGANCCLTARLQHEAKVTANHEPTRISVLIGSEPSPTTSRFPTELLRLTSLPLGPPIISTTTLTGTTIKRE